MANEIEQPQAARTPHLAPKIVIVDGQPGCGKTLLSHIVAGLDRVELLAYAYDLEHLCALWHLGKVQDDAARTFVRMSTDLKLYNLMMGRDANFRPSDLSSVWQSPRPWEYVSRLFSAGDEAVPARIKGKDPILHLTTHHLLMIGPPVFEALGERLVFVDMVRHPLYMVKQIALNMERLDESARNFTVHFRYEGRDLPYYVRGWEDLFLKSNPVERAIHAIDQWTAGRDRVASRMVRSGAALITVPFESFVTGPGPFLAQITGALRSAVTPVTRKIMKKQNVPRAMYAQGVGLPIYKRCGWEPPKSTDERKEFDLRRDWAARSASARAMDVLDRICKVYEDKHMKGGH